MLLPWLGLLALPYSCASSESGGSGGAVGTGGSTSSKQHGPSVASTVGSGGGGGGDALACIVPNDAPSKGSCVMITPGTGGGGDSAGATTGTGGGSQGAGGNAQGGGSAAGGGAATGGGGSSACSNVFNPSECADCIVQSCCAETAACYDANGCIACFVNDMSAKGCDAEPIVGPLAALQACEVKSCGTACGLTVVYHCNPVTNDGCDGAKGYACDLSGSATFDCFPPPNEERLCASCSVINSGPFCMPGSHCVVSDPMDTTGECGRYCCTNEDCGSGTCDTTALFPGSDKAVGICLSK